MLQKTDYGQEELEKLSKYEEWKQILLDSFVKWDEETSNKQCLTIKKNLVKHNVRYNLAAAFSKRKFVVGEENVLFNFTINAGINENIAAGVCLKKW